MDNVNGRSIILFIANSQCIETVRQSGWAEIKITIKTKTEWSSLTYDGYIFIYYMPLCVWSTTTHYYFRIFIFSVCWYFFMSFRCSHILSMHNFHYIYLFCVFNFSTRFFFVSFFIYSLLYYCNNINVVAGFRLLILLHVFLFSTFGSVKHHNNKYRCI